ncbi:MAG: aldo/keto reductase [Candidatus Bipolaricaulota bacterium]
MRYVRLGRSELEVSSLGLGTLPLGGRYGPPSPQQADRVVGRALDLGVNLFDTAPNYGQVEELLGRALGHRRGEVVIATKGGTARDKKGRLTNDAQPEALEEALNRSLKRLGTEWIDLYQLHLPDPTTPAELTWEALQEFVREGKIRYIGLSNFWEADLDAWPDDPTTVANQLPYNFLYRDIEAGLVQRCAERDLGVLAYQPLLSGLLTGGIPDTSGPGDHRADHPQFQETAQSCVALMDKLRPLADELQLTPAQLALAWVVSGPGVSCALAGTRRPEHLEPLARAAERGLSAEERAAVAEILAKTHVEIVRTVPMPVEEVLTGPYGPVARLAMGIKFRAPEGIQAGDQVNMDIVTGRLNGVRS